MASLIALSDEALFLQTLLQSSDTDEETISAIQEYLQNVTEDRDKKLDNYAALIRDLEARQEIRASEAKRMNDLVKRDESTVKRLKENLRFVFEANGWKAVDTNRFRLVLAQNGGKQPLTIDIPVEELEERFQKTAVIVAPNQDALREAIEDGEVIPGVTLEPRGSSVRIK